MSKSRMISRNPDGSVSVSALAALAGMVVTLVLAVAGAAWAVSSSLTALRESSDAKYATKDQVRELGVDMREVRKDIKELLGRVPKPK